MARKEVVTPIRQINRRMPEAGRIRLGRKTSKAMTYLEHLRFTSPDRDMLVQVAEMYGGKVAPWSDAKASPKDQHELIIEADYVDVILPPDCLSQWYEKWAGRGCERRCDGEVCEVAGRNEMESVACLCRANQRRECEPYTRLNVILPGVSFRGVWRMQSKGWNAMHELPGMVEAVEALAASGRNMTAQLSIAKQEKMVNGRKSHFIVPKLTLPATPEQIISGSANAGALDAGAVDMPALDPANVNDVPYAEPSGDPIGDIIEAEIVTEEETEVRRCAEQYGVDGRQLWQAIEASVNGDVERIKVAIAKMKSGEIQPDGFDGDGRVIWMKR